MFAQHVRWTSSPSPIQSARMFGPFSIKRATRAQFAGVVCVSVSLVSVVHAQTAEDPSVVAAARALAVEGVKLAQDQRCPEAIDKLERAEQLHHSAIVLAQLGECYIAGGRLVEGAEAMRSVLREGLPDEPSDALKRAHTNARELLDTTKPKIAMLTITVEVVGSTQAEVRLDGQPLPAALIGAPRPTDPGEHHIEARATGRLSAERRIILAPGQTATLALPLIVDPAGATTSKSVAAGNQRNEANGSRAASGSEGTGASRATRPPNHVPAFIAWGVAAAGLATGAAFGFVALDQTSKLDDACPANRCPPNESDHLDSAKRNGMISTLAFGVGAGAAVLGGVLYFLAGNKVESQPRAAADRRGPQRGTAARARLDVGPNGAALQLAF